MPATAATTRTATIQPHGPRRRSPTTRPCRARPLSAAYGSGPGGAVGVWSIGRATGPTRRWLGRSLDGQGAGAVDRHGAGSRTQRGRPLRPTVELGRGQHGAGPAHLGQEVGGVGGPLVGVARGGQRDEGVELGRHGGDPRRRGGHRAVHVLVGDVDRGVAGERLRAGEHLEQDQAGGIHVAAGVGDAALDLLGGQVGDRAEEHARLGVGGLVADGAGQPEVGDLHGAVVLAQDDVLGLDVAVDDAGPVRGAERLQDRGHDVEGRPRGERALCLHDLAQRLPGDVLHREEHVAVVVALVEDRHDVAGGTAGPRTAPRAGTG